MGHKKCKFGESCLLTASFGYRDGKGTQFCSKHKESKMVNLLCKSCECGKSRPTYNYDGLSANFCKECKEPDMINVNDKNCVCGTSRPSFNFDGLDPEYCSKCRKDGMINVKDDPCMCGKSSKANFNFNSNSSSINNKLKRLDEKYTPEEIFHKVFQNLPKWLFLIMPFFALTLWLTHNKKKWWYFHNGIFTFHYFASFLFITSLTTIVNQLINLFGYETNEYFTIIIFILLNFIFIKAFLKFYNESWRKSLIKLFAIYFLNSLIILITFILFVFYIYTIL